ncbi:6-phosphogluconolactonase, partial [Tessaracoccus lubricantis]
PWTRRSRPQECHHVKGLTLDVALLGVGVNGHIAFNEPDHADFADPRLVRLVDLDLASRQQQVDEGLFSRIDEVPKQALTLTVPALLNSRVWLVSVLGRAKGAAVRSMLTQPISEKLPATIVRKHPQAWIYLDRGAASSLDGSTP